MSRLTKNIAYNVGGQGLSLVLSFVAVRFVFRGLGGDALGLIYFNLSVSMALMMALELGIYKTIVREVASHYQSDPGYVRNLIGTASAFYWSSYVVLEIATYFLAPVLVKHWVHLATMPAATAIQVLRILAIGTLATLPRGLYDSLLVGLERMGQTNILRVAITATQQAGIFVVLLLHGGLFGVAYWIVFSCLAGLAAYFCVCGWALSFDFLWPRFGMDVIKKNWKFSTQVLAISIAGWFISESDKFVVSRLLPLGVMGFFTFAKGATSRCSIFTVAINEATYPHMSRLYKCGSVDGFRAEYGKLHDLVCLGIVPLYAAMPFVAIPLFSVIFNSYVARLLLLPVAIMALGGYLDGTVTVPNVAALAAGRPDIGAKNNTLAAVAVVLGCIVFTRLWGLAGASLSLVVFSVVAYAYAVPRICRECLKSAVGPWYAHMAKILALAVSTYGAVLVILYCQAKMTLGWLTLGYLSGSLGFLLLGYLTIGRELGDSLLLLLRVGMAKPADGVDPVL